MFDGQQLGETIVAQVKGFLEREVSPLRAENAELKQRIAALEDRPAPEKGDPGEPGRDAEAPALASIVEEFRSEAEAIIRDAVAAAVAELPPPEKGDPGEPGRDAEPDAMLAAVDAAVSKAVEALPKPKDGEPGKDAAGIVEALKDDGELVLTLQDGRLIRTGIRDGKKGKNGRDGFSLDDFDIRACEDGRSVILSFQKGEIRNEFELTFPVPIDRGVFKAGEEYVPGDAVTWGGSLWIAQRATSERPDAPDSGFRLAVKKGRDGKDAK